MNKKIIYYCLLALGGVAASLLAADRNMRSFSPTAVFVSGFCVHQRSVRSPTVYYCSDRGLREVERRYSDDLDEVVTYKVGRDVILRIYSLASSPSNKVDKGKVNFYVRFFDDANHTVPFALSRDTLRKIISCLPEDIRSRLALMYKFG